MQQKDIDASFQKQGTGRTSPEARRELRKHKADMNKRYGIKRDKGGKGFSMMVHKKIKGFEEGTDMARDTINELSKSTLKRYVKKSARELNWNGRIGRKSENREKGIDKAVHRVGGKYYPKHAKRAGTFGGHRKYEGAHSESDFTDPKTGERYPKKKGRTGPYRANEEYVDEAHTVSTKGYSGSKPMKWKNRQSTKGFINFKNSQPAGDEDRKVLDYHKGEAAKEGKVTSLRYRGPRTRGPNAPHIGQSHTTRGAATGAAVYYKSKDELGGRQRRAAWKRNKKDPSTSYKEEYEMNELDYFLDAYEQLDETSKEKARRYLDKAQDTDAPEDPHRMTRQQGNRARGMLRASKKLDEEYEMYEDEDENDIEYIDPDVSELVMNTIEQRPLEFQQTFADLMQQRIEDAVAEKKLEVASIFTVPEYEEEDESEEEPEEELEYEEEPEESEAEEEPEVQEEEEEQLDEKKAADPKWHGSGRYVSPAGHRGIEGFGSPKPKPKPKPKDKWGDRTTKYPKPEWNTLKGK